MARIAELEASEESAAAASVDYGKVTLERDNLRASLETANGRIGELEAKVFEFQNTLENREKDLADATAKISGLTAKLEASEKALADKGQQLDHLIKTRDLLTAGVLTPSADSYAAKMASAKTPEEREALRNQKRAGKIK
jgi:chromosome segregation ATPase